MRRYQFGLATFVAAALLLAACSDGATVAVSQPQQSGISVTGNGSVTVVPDIAVLSLGVEVTAKTVALARSQPAEAMAVTTTKASEPSSVRPCNSSMRPKRRPTTAAMGSAKPSTTTASAAIA